MSGRDRSRLLGWWVFTRRVVQALTTPAGDVAGCDHEIERLARESWLGSLARRAGAAIGEAWWQSRSRAVASAFVNELKPPPAAAAIRAAGWTATVAGATALMLNVFRPLSSGPFTWVVPAVAAAVGVVMTAASATLARMYEERQ
jgi:hypothetical protein